MKHGWIVLLFTACVVRVSSPFHLPPPDPDPEPAPERSAGPTPGSARLERHTQLRAAPRSAADERTTEVAHHYDRLQDDIAQAAQKAAAHRCDGSCATDGWTNDTVANGSARSTCHDNCLTQGWTTRFPDGTAANAECNGGDCRKHGWKTFFPDGGIAITTCDGGDCLKYGWTTALPPGGTMDCACGGTCVSEGADCL